MISKTMDYKEKVIALLNGQELSKEQKEKLESIFPELAESEDERIRKELISALKFANVKGVYDEHIAWLEKQNEQKPVNDTDEDIVEAVKDISILDLVEPKFKVGDWVIFAENHNSVYQVERIDNNRYYLRHYLGGTLSVYFDNDLIRLWTIQDAKDGDVLVSKYNKPFIYNGKYDEYYVGAYCGIVCDGSMFIETNSVCQWADNKKITPATKEQRDQLEKAMADVGYEFDFKEKVLKKIEQKSAWSEEEEELCNVLMNICGGPHDEMDGRPWAKCINWLKSLKERYTWKPSDEQIEILDMVLSNESMDDNVASILRKLREQLKKLREE